jgi:predicted methyltransferase
MKLQLNADRRRTTGVAVAALLLGLAAFAVGEQWAIGESDRFTLRFVKP